MNGGRYLTKKTLLLQIMEQVAQLERKVDYLVAKTNGDKAAIQAATEKLSASTDALDQAVKDAANPTEP
jgi:hypothetical protein